MNFLNIRIPEATKNEMDGVAFTGAVSVSNLKVTRQGNKVTLRWNVLNPAGEAEIKISKTNGFPTGKPDAYLPAGKVAVSQGTFTFELPKSQSGLFKILLVAPDNSVNVWLKTR
jgi:hypothetical protein